MIADHFVADSALKKVQLKYIILFEKNGLRGAFDPNLALRDTLKISLCLPFSCDSSLCAE